MSLTPGTRIGVFEIVGKLGEGGMGEVYRARDATLGRDVALKILPATFASDPDRLMRFEREAKLLASLNHPHIAHIYGFEVGPDSTGGSRVLVMELVEGEDLSARVERGAIPLDEALPIARQIVAALESAHDAGIVHRDLKPSNIKLHANGTVKVLDFGLAKAGGASGPGPAGATMTSPAITMHGVILGTAAYMSPEQAKGKPVDKRTDIWAFGCVLYEMLTGRRAFAGEDITETLTAIMRDTPAWSALPQDTPASVRRLIAKCLERDPKRRLRDIGDALSDLDDSTRSAAPSIPTRSRVLWYVAVALVGGLVIGSVVSRSWPVPTASSPNATPVVAHIAPPPGVIAAFFDGFALSPDERMLAFAARDRNGLRQIWLRRIDSTEARPIPNTEGGRYPFWSPDSTQIAFFVESALRRVAIAGGPFQAICAVDGRFPTGSWGDADKILFGVVQGSRASVFTVAASGGTPEPVDIVGGALRPQWLAGGREFLYTHLETNSVRRRTEGGEDRDVLPIEPPTMPDGSWNFAYSSGGYLFVNRNRVLTGQRFDPATRALDGSAVPLAGAAGTPNTWFSVSAAGTTLAAAVRRTADDTGSPGDPPSRLRWATRQGEFIGDVGEVNSYWSLRLAPDGRSVAANFGDPSIWLLQSGSRRVPLTTTPNGQDFFPVWSPDGRDLVFFRVTDDAGSTFRRAVGAHGAETVLKGMRGLTTDWSRDGTTLLLTTDNSAASRRDDVSVYDLATSTMSPWLPTTAAEHHARFSPDGRWIVYTSDASGRSEVLVGARRGGGTPLPVSSGGGRHAVWRSDGRELFYLGPNDELMAVAVTSAGDGLQLGEPARLFRIPLNDLNETTPYDVSPDGQRFLLNVPEAPLPLLFIRGVDRLISGGGR